MKQYIKRAFRALGLDVRRASAKPDFIVPIEFSKADLEVLDFVRSNRLSMVGPERLVATINACKHAVLAGIEGDFVECGVWRGGNSIAAKMTFENYGSSKQVYLFDTFAGMTPPTAEDSTSHDQRSVEERFQQAQKGDHNDWCFASLEDVRNNFANAGVSSDGVHFIKGDVMKTLNEPASVPDSISVLRLDTDFYDSTKAEMEHLYPRLSSGGSLLIDDFGHWDGARKAITEYLERLPPHSRPLLHYTDYSGRMGIKP